MNQITEYAPRVELRIIDTALFIDGNLKVKFIGQALNEARKIAGAKKGDENHFHHGVIVAVTFEGPNIVGIAKVPVLRAIGKQYGQIIEAVSK